MMNSLPDPNEDWMCTACGKDPYKSSTGCLCPPGQSNWVKGQKGSYGECPALDVGDDGREDLKCPGCGNKRDRASKAPNRVLPCNCGDQTELAIDVINKNKTDGK